MKSKKKKMKENLIYKEILYKRAKPIWDWHLEIYYDPKSQEMWWKIYDNEKNFESRFNIFEYDFNKNVSRIISGKDDDLTHDKFKIALKIENWIKKVKSKMKETPETSARYESFKMEVEGDGGCAKLIDSLKNESGFYPEELTPNILLNLKIIPAFNKEPSIYLKWASEENKRLKEEKTSENPEEIFSPQGQTRFYVQEQPIFYDKNCLWWVWNKEEKKWKISDEIDILNHIENTEKFQGKNIINPRSRTLILNSLKQECRKTIPKEIKSTWIQFKDKIFDIETGEEFEAVPDYFVTNPIPWKMHNNNYEETPVMDKIFEEWVGEKYKKTLYEIIAYCMLPDYPIHRLFCLIGIGMNGKGCFLRLLKKFVGKENTTSTELDRLTNSRFEVTRLHKKLVCMLGETDFTEMRQTALIKSLTGQDEIPFEYKNKTPFTDTNYAKLIIATNNLPTTLDKTVGWYRRWCIIDFPNQFSEKKNILDDIPEEEYESLTLKCTRILIDLLKNKKFHEEGSIEERMAKYESKSDFLHKFIEDFVEGDIDGYITSSEFHKKFRDWCKENRHRELSEQSLGRKLKEKGYESERKYFDWLFDGKGGQLRVWVGIRWKN